MPAHALHGQILSPESGMQRIGSHHLAIFLEKKSSNSKAYYYGLFRLLFLIQNLEIIKISRKLSCINITVKSY